VKLIIATPGSGALLLAHAAAAGFGLHVRVEREPQAHAGADSVLVRGLDPFALVPTDLDPIATLVLRNPAHWVSALARRHMISTPEDARRALDSWRAFALCWIERERALGTPGAACVDDLRLEPHRVLAPLWAHWGLAYTARALDRAIRDRERWYRLGANRRTRWLNPDRPRCSRLRVAPWADVHAVLIEPPFDALAERFEWPTKPKRYGVRE